MPSKFIIFLQTSHGVLGTPSRIQNAAVTIFESETEDTLFILSTRPPHNLSRFHSLNFSFALLYFSLSSAKSGFLKADILLLPFPKMECLFPYVWGLKEISLLLVSICNLGVSVESDSYTIGFNETWQSWSNKTVVSFSNIAWDSSVKVEVESDSMISINFQRVHLKMRPLRQKIWRRHQRLRHSLSVTNSTFSFRVNLHNTMPSTFPDYKVLFY